MSQEADDTARLLEVFQSFDSIEKLIFLSGLRALEADTMTIHQFKERMDDLFKRYRAGEKFTPADLADLTS